MDEEERINSEKKITVSKVKVNDKRLKINFLWIFIICIMIMITDQIVKYLDYCPELFYGGDYIYHIIQSTVTICSQLSVSIASAIIFYYVLEFVNQNKIIDKFEKIKKYSILILCAHMDIICNVESFKKLNRNRPRLSYPSARFYIIDIPIFLDCYYNCNKDKFKGDLHDYFLEVEGDTETERPCFEDLLEIQIKVNIDKLSQYRYISFYKGYKKDIEELQSIYENIQYYHNLYFAKSCNINKLIDDVIDEYIILLDKSLYIYIIIERYIQCLRNKHFVEFLKMRD